MTSLSVVVARYDEDLTWLKPILPMCYIYNKGQPLHDHGFNIIPMHNIGREADTYLNYIINNYDSLPDYVFFTQGHVGDHVQDVKEIYIIINALLNADITTQYYNFATMKNHRLWKIDNFYDGFHPELPLRDVWKKLFDADGTTLLCNYNAVFIASKERIQFHSKAFYQRALQLNNANANGPYVMERLWRTIFDGKTQEKN